MCACFGDGTRVNDNCLGTSSRKQFVFYYYFKFLLPLGKIILVSNDYSFLSLVDDPRQSTGTDYRSSFVFQTTSRLCSRSYGRLLCRTDWRYIIPLQKTIQIRTKILNRVTIINYKFSMTSWHLKLFDIAIYNCFVNSLVMFGMWPVCRYNRIQQYCRFRKMIQASVQ